MPAHPLPAIPSHSVWATKKAQDAEASFYEATNLPEPVWRERFAWEMRAAHSLFTNLVKRVYLFAHDAVEQDDLLNYLGFSEVAIYQVYNHHHFEETVIFPYLIEHGADRASLEGNVQDHHTFTRAMDATWLYIRRVRALLPDAARYPSPVPEPDEEIQTIDIVGEYGLDPSKGFDPTLLQKHMDTWLGTMMDHMLEEIDTIGPSMTEAVGEENLKQLGVIVLKHLQAYDPKWFLCSSFATVNMDCCKTLLKLPYLVRRILVPYVWAGKYWGMWQYCEHPENLTWAGTA
ncbi:hypothetical protein BD324DRAFT_638735 [Kockovaella imperatae]|uniref:Hemerythrin-like domain-containing protein n=1 Tax=Kockovaella imperatae TaxID=4999 RepID=A0A1Y1U706_9TREE|nr:hypothetical protein BD324DRAFT_638735 [Kockovaella imperatae]ORX33823.1 hypothetical protein BD324DRAFT_638735 [Kockovaella imperatae]